jgi:outer membrane protein OmpA-like peptidoglycan-associated protein
MKFLILPSCLTSLMIASALSGCAAVVPQELANARTAYHRASTGPAARSKPAEVHKADEALRQAEQAFSDDPTAYHTLDLAYIAQRKAEMAEALDEIDAQEAKVAQADAEFTSTQTQIMKQTKAALNQSRSDLADSERDGQKGQENLAAEKKARAEARVETDKREAATGAQLATEQAARAAAEKRASDAVQALAKLAAVKEEARGMVITLSGSVLFASDKSALLPSAQARLSSVAEALLANKQRTIVVEGHSDSKGKDAYNMELSLHRAEAVRSFLVSKGYDPSRITAQGIGKDRPIADNATVEGRANNRRVEIVVSPEAKH